jgi:uncharacterized protein (DUF427 family)
MIRATWNRTVIAESDNTIIVEGNHYFPRDDVNMNLLTESPAHTRCPWKGKASYYTLMVGDDVNVDAAWYYPYPTFLARKVQDRIAFWRGVHVDEVIQASNARH